MNRDDLHEYLPYRDPCLFIHGVIKFTGGDGIECLLRVTGDETFFEGHFPGHPIFPGVLEIEAMLQAAELFLNLENGIKNPRSSPELLKINSARFQKPIYPPKDLTVSVELKSKNDKEIRFKGNIGDKMEEYASANFTLKSNKRNHA